MNAQFQVFFKVETLALADRDRYFFKKKVFFVCAEKRGKI